MKNEFPKWFNEGIRSPFRAGIASVFLLHGDTTCLVANPDAEAEPQWPYLPIQEFFSRAFGKADMVLFYNIATGIRFLKPEMEQEFRKVAELEPSSTADPADPVAVAKAGLAAKRAMPREPELCLPLIEKALNKLERVAVIIESAHFIAAESTSNTLTQIERTNIERIRTWAQDARVKKKINIVLLMTSLASKVSGELRQTSSRINMVHIPKPSAEERRDYITWLVKGSGERQEISEQIATLEKKQKRAKGAAKENLSEEIDGLKEQLKPFPPCFAVAEDFDTDIFVNATQGMSLRQILEIFRYSREARQPADLLYVRKKKLEILNAEHGDVMEIVDPDWGLDDIGGLEWLKAHYREILDALAKGNSNAVPQGMTLMGPPGTAKTAIVEALAKGAGYILIKMKNALSMWVGQSEERTERQLKGAMDLAPCVIMNDEADLNDANRDAPKGDSGVSERIMQARMKFLSDPKIQGKVIMVNCTNRPGRMDPALKRSGRSDDRIALLMPPEEERPAIFVVMFRKYKIATSITDFSPYAKLVGEISGADIRKIVLDAAKFAGRKGKKAVDDASLREAIDDFIPSASQADIDLMTLEAVSESSSRRLLPPNTREILLAIRKRNLVAGGLEILAQIEARNIVRLDEDRATGK